MAFAFYKGRIDPFEELNNGLVMKLYCEDCGSSERDTLDYALFAECLLRKGEP
jgi:hypothetical protein